MSKLLIMFIVPNADSDPFRPESARLHCRNANLPQFLTPTLAFGFSMFFFVIFLGLLSAFAFFSKGFGGSQREEPLFLFFVVSLLFTNREALKGADGVGVKFLIFQ